MGLEPTTLKFQVWCSTDWASRACWMLSFKWPYYIYVLPIPMYTLLSCHYIISMNKTLNHNQTHYYSKSETVILKVLFYLRSIDLLVYAYRLYWLCILEWTLFTWLLHVCSVLKNVGLVAWHKFENQRRIGWMEFYLPHNQRNQNSYNWLNDVKKKNLLLFKTTNHCWQRLWNLSSNLSERNVRARGISASLCIHGLPMRSVVIDINSLSKNWTLVLGRITSCVFISFLIINI